MKLKLLNISTQALRIAAEDVYKTFSSLELHVMFKRFTPDQMTHYLSLLSLFRCVNNKIPESIWLTLQINGLPLTRANKILFPPKNKLKVGTNALYNRLSYVSTLITNDDLDKEYIAFKIQCKKFVLLLN